MCVAVNGEKEDFRKKIQRILFLKKRDPFPIWKHSSPFCRWKSSGISKIWQYFVSMKDVPSS